MKRIMLYLMLVLVTAVAALAQPGVTEDAEAHHGWVEEGVYVHWWDGADGTYDGVRYPYIYKDLTGWWFERISAHHHQWAAGATRIVHPGGLWAWTDGNRYSCGMGAIPRGVRVCNWSNYNGLGNGGSPYAGLTTILLFEVQGHYHVQKIQVRLDDTYSGLASGNTKYANMTACHELGHVFGLDHRWTGNSCMNVVAGGNLDYIQNPDSHDYHQVDIGHNHIDSAGYAQASAAATAARGMGTMRVPRIAKNDRRVKKIDKYTRIRRISKKRLILKHFDPPVRERRR